MTNFPHFKKYSRYDESQQTTVTDTTMTEKKQSSIKINISRTPDEALSDAISNVVETLAPTPSLPQLKAMEWAKSDRGMFTLLTAGISPRIAFAEIKAGNYSSDTYTTNLIATIEHHFGKSQEIRLFPLDQFPQAQQWCEEQIKERAQAFLEMYFEV